MSITPFSYKRFVGIYNQEDLVGANETIRLNTRSNGNAFLSTARNFYIDEHGKLHTRPGYSQVSAGSYHSLSADGDPILAVKGGNLVSIHVDSAFSETVLLTGMGNGRTTYTSFLGRKYFTNGSVIGYVLNNTAYTLPNPGDRYFRPLPAGNLIKKWGNRLLVAKDGLVIFSEVAGDFYDIRNDSAFWNIGGKITMIEPVQDGCFVSNESKVYFMTGNDPTDVQVKDISASGAWEGSSVQCGDIIFKPVMGNPISPNTAIMWASDAGIFVGWESENVFNITEKWYNMPSSSTAAGVAVQNISGLPTQYICTINQ